MSRKRRSLQKRLMGSTESLNRLDELAASRASKIINQSLSVIRYRHVCESSSSSFLLLPFFLHSICCRHFAVPKTMRESFTLHFYSKTLPISNVFLSNVIFLRDITMSSAVRLALLARRVFSSVRKGDFQPIMYRRMQPDYCSRQEIMPRDE